MRPLRAWVYSFGKVLFLDESGHEPQLRAVHADGATAKSAKMGGEARPSGSGVGLMHRLLRAWVYSFSPSSPKKCLHRAFRGFQELITHSYALSSALLPPSSALTIAGLAGGDNEDGLID